MSVGSKSWRDQQMINLNLTGSIVTFGTARKSLGAWVDTLTGPITDVPYERSNETK